MRLEGTRSDRMALGATVTVTVGGRPHAQVLLSQSSYYSHDDLRLHFGLGAASRVDEIEVHWPGGDVQRLSNIDVRRVVTIARR